MSKNDTTGSTQKKSAIKLTDDDVIAAMKEVDGYVDITTDDFRALFLIAMKFARKRFLRATPVKEIMRSKVVCIEPDADLQHIISALAENAVSGLPVVDSRKNVVGVLSEKDIFNRLSGKEGTSFWGVLSGCLHQNGCLMKSVISLRAKDVMTAPAVVLLESASIRDALELLQAKEVNRLPIIDDDGRLAGIVTRSDVINAHIEFGEE